MKQKDIAIIAAVVLASSILAIVASKMLIRSTDKHQKVEVVQAISPDFSTPDPRFFNGQSLDPTLQIQIGNNANADPFKGGNGQ